MTAFVSAIVLAAGRSGRMGEADKLVQSVDGAPLLRRVAQAALASGAGEVVVVLGPAEDRRTADRRAALAGLDVLVAHNDRSEEGMASSIRAGLAAVSARSDAAAILPADLPLLDAAHVDAVIAGFNPRDRFAIRRALDERGDPGHPVLFGRGHFGALAALEGDQGARAVLAAHPDRVTEVATPGLGATTDLDTPEDWRAFLGGGAG